MRHKDPLLRVLSQMEEPSTVKYTGSDVDTTTTVTTVTPVSGIMKFAPYIPFIALSLQMVSLVLFIYILSTRK